MITLTQTFASSDEIEDHFADIESNRKAARVLREIKDWLRSEIKYANRQELEPARDMLFELAVEEGLDLHEL